MRVAVLGAAGTIGPAIARDLAESDEVDELVLLDRDGGDGIAAVDATDRDALVAALDGSALVVNAVSYRLNLAVMRACLSAGCDYIDLGGLYHVTARQLTLHDEFARAGRLAILGCGAAPGKTNVMAAHLAAGLDVVDEIRCASAGFDPDPPAGFWTPYALQTLIDEVTLEPIVVRDGNPQPIAPLTEGGEIDFPEPIGRCASIFTLHSEVLTLQAASCDFRLCLPDAVRARLVAGDTEGRSGPSASTWSAQRVDVSGTRDGAATTRTMTALTRPHEPWGFGGGVMSTAGAAAATARLYARGELRRTGAHPPERVLPPESFFAELDTRGCRVEIAAW